MTFSIEFMAGIIAENDYGADPYENDRESDVYKKAKAIAEKVFEKLSDAQKEFVDKAIDEGFEDKLHFLYSGRGMYGETCPAVYLDNVSDFGFRNSSSDAMGKGAVIYKRT